MGIEICIETVFDGIHYATRFVLSPFESIRMLLRWFFSRSMGKPRPDEPGTSVCTATLADTNPAPKEKKTNLSSRLNTDARTCRDVITEQG